MHLIVPLKSGYENIDYYGICNNCDHNKYTPKQACGYICIVGTNDSKVIVTLVLPAHTDRIVSWDDQYIKWRTIKKEFERKFFISKNEADKYAAKWISGFLFQGLIDSIANIFTEDIFVCEYCGHEL